MGARKLTDADVLAIREAFAAGTPARELAATYSVSVQHVYRITSGIQRAALGARAGVDGDGPVSAALATLISGIELDASRGVIAATAQAVARKLDAAVSSDAIAAAAATPALARQLTELIVQLPTQSAGVDRAIAALSAARGRR